MPSVSIIIIKLAFGLLTSLIVSVKLAGVGRHFAAVHTTQQMVVYWKLSFTLTFCYSAAANLPRLGILALYLRIFKVSRYRWAAYAVSGIIIVNWIALQSTHLAMCRPIRFNWDKTIENGHCIDQRKFHRWATVPNIATDTVMFFLPIPAVWNLQMSRAQRAGVIVTFCLGSMYEILSPSFFSLGNGWLIPYSGLFTAIFRLWIFVNLRSSKDITWFSFDTYTWTVAETGVYLIAACLPSLRPLFKHIVKDIDIRSVRSLFGSDSRAHSEKSIRHKDVSSTAVDYQSRPGINSGFERLCDDLHPALPDGSKPKGAAACYSEFPLHQIDLGKKRGEDESGIRIERLYGTSHLV